MWVWVDRLGAALIDASLAALALSILVSLAMLGTRQPARRVRLARAGLLGALALLPLSRLAPLPRVDVIAALRGSVLPDLADRGPGRPARQVALVCLAGWSCGLAWLAIGHGGLAWLTRRSAPPSGEALDLYGSLPFAARAPRPRLRVVPRLRGPALVGPFRPMILIPDGLDRPGSASTLRLGLLHELAHAEAADSWSRLVASLAAAFWFFLPTVWWVRRQMSLDQEFLADHRAAIHFGATSSYASALVDLSGPAARASGTPRHATGGQAGAGSALLQRVRMLLLCPFPVESAPPRWWSWAMSGTIVAVTLGASTLSLATAPGAPGPDPSGARTFRMSRLVVPAKTGGYQGRAPLFEMPLRLPDHFDLTVDVWGDLDTLAQTRVVGHPLEIPAGPFDPLGDWHRVRVRRDVLGVALWVDGRAAAVDPRRGTTTTWLSIESAPGLPGYYQDLCLTW